jgi:hypothetical protein
MSSLLIWLLFHPAKQFSAASFRYSAQSDEIFFKRKNRLQIRFKAKEKNMIYDVKQQFSTDSADFE